MKTLRNNGTSDDNIVQNRFIAYLKISISRQKVKYLDKLFDQRKWELSFEEHEDTLNSLPSSGGAYFNKEVEDESLCRALNKLKDHERVIVFRRAVSEESFIKIAADMGLALNKRLICQFPYGGGRAVIVKTSRKGAAAEMVVQIPDRPVE